MTDFRLQKSFGIDAGELDGLSPQDCFCLGYELAMIDELLASGDTPIVRPVHAANETRIRKSCKQFGYGCSLSWMGDDSSETWMTLEARSDERRHEDHD